MNTELCIGLMSGTSMDGVDAALLETDGESIIKTHGSTFLSYHNDFRVLLKTLEHAVKVEKGNLDAARKNYQIHQHHYLQKILALEDSPFTDKSVNQIDFDFIVECSTQIHAQAVQQLQKKFKIARKDIRVIGYHGQTLYHKPEKKFTIQVGNAESLAYQCQMDVVHNFRENDILNGGQGAPFAPLYHQALAKRDNLLPAIIINCGGITNLSFINNEHLIAFDIGPGNALLDRFVHHKTKGEYFFDQDGQFSKLGRVETRFIENLYEKSCRIHNKNFYEQLPCKSLDINDLVLPEEILELSLTDGSANLAYFTAYCIIKSLKFLPSVVFKPQQKINWILTGGGWHNPSITSALQQLLPKSARLIQANSINWDVNALEAETFAYLALRSIKQLPLSLPSTTGVAFPCRGGSYTQFTSK